MYDAKESAYNAIPLSCSRGTCLTTTVSVRWSDETPLLRRSPCGGRVRPCGSAVGPPVCRGNCRACVATPEE